VWQKRVDSHRKGEASLISELRLLHPPPSPKTAALQRKMLMKGDDSVAYARIQVRLVFSLIHFEALDDTNPSKSPLSFSFSLILSFPCSRTRILPPQPFTIFFCFILLRLRQLRRGRDRLSRRTYALLVYFDRSLTCAPLTLLTICLYHFRNHDQAVATAARQRQVAAEDRRTFMSFRTARKARRRRRRQRRRTDNDATVAVADDDDDNDDDDNDDDDDDDIADGDDSDSTDPDISNAMPSHNARTSFGVGFGGGGGGGGDAFEIDSDDDQVGFSMSASVNYYLPLLANTYSFLFVSYLPSLLLPFEIDSDDDQVGSSTSASVNHHLPLLANTHVRDCQSSLAFASKHSLFFCSFLTFPHLTLPYITFSLQMNGRSEWRRRRLGGDLSIITCLC
jgi:hypothetical protein